MGEILCVGLTWKGLLDIVFKSEAGHIAACPCTIAGHED